MTQELMDGLPYPLTGRSSGSGRRRAGAAGKCGDGTADTGGCRIR